MAAGGVVALKLVVNLRRGPQGFFQAVSPDQRGGAVHLVKLQDLVGDVEVAGLGVHFLVGQLFAEDRVEVLLRGGFAGGGVQKGIGLLFHVGPEVVPLLRHLVFGEVDSVGDGFHR